MTQRADDLRLTVFLDPERDSALYAALAKVPKGKPRTRALVNLAFAGLGILGAAAAAPGGTPAVRHEEAPGRVGASGRKAVRFDELFPEDNLGR